MTAAPAESPAPRVKPPQRRLRFSFNGTARDYFGIWIVNTMLKIVTFGIYSAWAKVRKRRYFYGNTTLDRTPFEYLADPIALFKGWLVAALFFILYSVGSKAYPALGSILGPIFFVVVPWLIVRSRIFNLRYSSHRNICFTFAPNYREAYLVFAGLPFLLPFTLGLMGPYMVYRQKKFLVENSSYGRTRCTFDATPKDYYLVFIKAIAWFVATVLALFLLVYLISDVVRDLSLLFVNLRSQADMKARIVTAVGTALAVIMFFYLFITIYVRTELANVTWNATRLKNSRFLSTLKVGTMAWLYLSSAVAILFSFGLLIPWATVRIARYRLENLSLEIRDDHEVFLACGQKDINSTGEEIGDMFGIEIGL